MKWLAISVGVGIVATYFLMRSADRPGDDFGAVFPGLLAGAITTVLIVAYFIAALWTHRFPW